MEMLKAKPERDRQRFSITYLQSKVESLLTFYGSEMESNVYPGAATAPRAAGMCLLTSSVWFVLFYFFPSMSYSLPVSQPVNLFVYKQCVETILALK